VQRFGQNVFSVSELPEPEVILSNSVLPFRELEG